MTSSAIQTSYAGCRFRSRLEARWAVFFDHMDIRWEYEPQGFVVGGRPYLPDFRLSETGTWVEVKGSDDALDANLMLAAAEELPGNGHPLLLILGPIPEPPRNGDWAWMGFERWEGDDIPEASDAWFGFGSGHLDHARETSCAPEWTSGNTDGWLTPHRDMEPRHDKAALAYLAARGARFEHGENGAAR